MCLCSAKDATGYSARTGEVALFSVPVVCGPRRWPVARRPFDSWELFFLLFFFKVTLNALRVSAYLATQTFPPPPPPQFSSLARFSCVNPNCLLCVKDNICTVVVFGQEITVFCREQWPSCCDYQILNLSAFRTCLTSPTAHFFHLVRSFLDICYENLVI